MKRTELRRTTPMKRTSTPLNRYVSGETPTPKQRKPIKRKRAKPRKWANVAARRKYVENVAVCEYLAITGCTRPPVDAEHYLGRGLFASDDPLALLGLCRECHDDIKRSHAAAVNGIWIKLRELTRFSTPDYVKFLAGLGFHIAVLSNWLTDGSLTDEAVRKRCVQVLAWVGLSETGE